VQNPPAGAQPPAPGQRGGGWSGTQARGAGDVVTTFAFPDGGTIPIRHSQVGPEASPQLAWSNVPDGVSSFVLIVHDLDATTAQQNQAQTGTVTDLLHWMVWNIPGAARGLPEGIPQGPDLPDGSRQISRTGQHLSRPSAPAAGPVHHYVFELYALDRCSRSRPSARHPTTPRRGPRRHRWPPARQGDHDWHVQAWRIAGLSFSATPATSCACFISRRA
jgi:Raf kinase inhibitor-like YbhB/YbcL family protein